jgi:PAS domain S-box-containing protein
MSNTQVTSAADQARDELSYPYIPDIWKPLLISGLFTLVILMGGYSVFQRHKQIIIIEEQNNLSAIAELKIGQITTWMAERRSEAQIFKDDPMFVSYVADWFRRGSPAGEAREKIAARLSSLQQIHGISGYTSISLLDEKARMHLTLPADEAPIIDIEKAMLFESMGSGQVAFSDIRKEKHLNNEVIEIDLVAPLLTGKNGRKHPVGAILFRINPHHFLFPLIQHWPTPSTTGENLLVRRDGDKVLYLNTLRHSADTKLYMSFAFDLRLPAAMAILGQEGLMEGIDHRGVPVVSVLGRVPGTSWFMVSKIDKAEIYAPIDQLANWMLLLILSLISAGGAIAVYWWQKKNKQHESRLKQQRLTQHLDFLSKYANDIILQLDSSGKILAFNDRALDTYGYTADELSNMSIDDLRVEEFSIPHSDRVKKIDQGGGVLIFESMHLKKNGEHFPVESSARTIEIAGVKFYQAVIRDITERKKAEGEIVRQKQFIRQIIDSDPNLIFVKDADGRFLLANEALAKSYGQTIDGIIGKKNSDFIADPELLASYDSISREVLGNQIERVAIESGRLSDGKDRWFKTIRKPLEQNDGSISLLTIAMDVTDLKETEQEQLRLNRAYRLLSSCNQAIMYSAEENALLTEVCKLIVEKGGYRMAWIGFAEHDAEKSVRPVARYGADAGYLDSAKISWAEVEHGQGPIGIAIRTGVTQINQDFQTNPLLALWRAAAVARGYQSSIAIPFYCEDLVCGALTIYSAQAHAFSTGETALLEELSDNLSFGITALRTRAERTHAVEKLQKSEEHFRFLAENATDMTFLMTLPDGGYSYVSPSSTHLTGFQPEEFYESPRLMLSIIHPDWHAYCAEQWDKLIRGEVDAYFEFQIIHKSGETRWINQRNAPIWDEDGGGVLIAIQGMVSDITERKRAELELQQQKAFIRQVIDANPNQIFVKDAKGNFLMGNQSLADSYGMTTNQLIGKNQSELNHFPEEVEKYLDADCKVIKEGREIRLVEPCTLPDGERRWFLTIKKPLTMPDGQLSVLCIAMDITEQKLSEIQLAESYRKLQRLSLHLENVRADERARIALNLHDEMGATLVAIKMSIAWLATRLPTEAPLLSAEVARITELVAGGIQTMHQIVMQLRPNLLGDVGLAAAIRDYVKKFSQHTNIKCKLVLPVDEFSLGVDQSLTLFRILQESLNNVAKHAQASRVEIVFTAREDSISMAVKDNGIGFDTNARNEQSLGLLGIRERALMVGGKARISSTAGKGTRVTVSIPTPDFLNLHDA